MTLVYLLQAFLPLILISWIAFAPQRSVVGFWVQILASALSIAAIALVGIWLVPPWWAPYMFGVFFAVVIVFRLRRRMPTRWSPTGSVAWLTTACFGVLAVFAGDQTRLAVAARQIPPGSAMDLVSPLGPGRYLVVNGGTSTAINAHADALDQSIIAHRAFHGTAYGVDIVALDSLGMRADGVMSSDPTRYQIFGMPVSAPCAGKVILAVDGLPDMKIPNQDERHLAGNHVILRCNGTDILLAHFKKGTLMVHKNDLLEIGAPIARVGNSGATSEPHLHVHAQRQGTMDAPFSGSPIPVRLDGRFLVRNDRFDVPVRRSFKGSPNE
jgi:Peptidase family M23